MTIGFRPTVEDSEKLSIINKFLGDSSDTGALRFALNIAVQSIEKFSPLPAKKPKPLMCPKHNGYWFSCKCDPKEQGFD